MLCKKCGRIVDKNMNFCPYCQTKIEKDVLYNQNTNQYQNTYNGNNSFQQNVYNANVNYNSSKTSKQKHNSKPLIYVIGIVLLMILILCTNGQGVLRFSNFDYLIDDFGEINTTKPNYNNDLAISTGTRTFMIYIIGSDLESDDGAATKDINEMLKSNYNVEDVNVLLYTGGTRRWRNDTISSKENAIYELNGNKLKKVNSYSKKSMSNPNTLTEFIDYVYEKYGCGEKFNLDYKL